MNIKMSSELSRIPVPSGPNQPEIGAEMKKVPSMDTGTQQSVHDPKITGRILLNIWRLMRCEVSG